VAVVVAVGVVDSKEILMRARNWLLIAALIAPLALGAPSGEKAFKTPEAAVQALIKGIQAKDAQALLGVLGSVAKPLIDSGDPVADKNARDGFLAKYNAKHSLDKSTPDKVTLNVGEDDWPFPIPVVSKDGGWYFDSAAGAEEIINRRVGENELSTIQSCLAYVDAQQEYYLRNVQKDPLQHYANKLISSPGKKDGLYWPAAADEPQSPLGEEFVAARAEGYLKAGTPKGSPFHGYIYRILTRQGLSAAGGAYDYTVNGELLGGFGMIAFPAEYGSTGVMSFIVNQDGVVYSRDLGPHTEEVAMGVAEFNPDTMWTKEDGATTVAGK
jgi:Protein of unknown function (DUF2950)